MTWKEIKGGAESLFLLADIDNADLSMTASTTPSANWPTGVRPFVVRVRNTTHSTEEKMLCAALAGAGFTILTRGYDGTLAVGHTAGEEIAHVADADTIQEANAHVNDATRDDHGQYLNVARHDVTARHTFGAALGTPSAPPSTAAVSAAGSGSGPARSDHTHAVGAATVPAGGLGVGAISASNQFAAGVVDGAAVAAAIKDAAAGTPSLRSLGATAITAAAGNDSRLSDSRAPTGAAGGVLSGTYPNPAFLAGTAAVPTTTTTWSPSPTWQQGIAFTVTTSYAKYVRSGPTVTFWAAFTITSGGSTGQLFAVTLPFSHVFGALDIAIGGGTLFVDSSNFFGGVLTAWGNNPTKAYINFTSLLATSLTANPGQLLTITGSYPVA